MARIMSHLDKENPRYQKKVIKLYYAAHNKLQPIFKFDAFWWIKRNTVVLLRLTLILVICVWGKMK